MAFANDKEYCAYSHIASMLERTGTNWLIAVYETYLDDSGTNTQSPIAIAAGYVSTELGWKRFVRDWDVARCEEGFDAFHMAEFTAPREQGHRPWCEWDNAKKDRVYKRLATIINENKRIGIGVAVPKKVYDSVPERIRQHYGFEHYTFAVRMFLMRIADWREKSMIALPMQYILDWESLESPKRVEITNTLESVHPKLKSLFGLEDGGYQFQKKKYFKPLQAADILAWQMNTYMPKIYPQGETEENVTQLLHPGFKMLRVDQEMDLGFFSETNMGAWVARIEEYERIHGIIY